ncbi:hypothetical protein FACS189420_7750 [Bacteroidia bacterium]|nr:hypothetical protein FACS189420_7750 [Bacteroidia bacterium]
MLTFTGMDTYQAKISLLDVVENKRIDLTGLSAYEYTFNYTPVQQNGQVIANEDRFFIELKSAGSTTGWEDEPFSEIAIYASPQTIHIVSPEPVSQVSVYTLQGALVRTAKEVNAIRNINPGVYIVKAVTAKGVKTAKVIVK